MQDDNDNVRKEDAQITGRTEGPFGSDDTDADLHAEDNKHRKIQENSANGTDSVQIRGGQNGRNIRGVGSTDMDSEHGLLRRGDQDNSTMEVPDEALDQAAASASGTNTGMVDVTTSGPDDYGSADKVGVPNAQKAAKEHDGEETNWDEENSRDDMGEPQTEADKDIAETGTDLKNQPPY